MRVSVRTSVVLWLVVVLLPVLAASAFALVLVEGHLIERVERDLANTARLEAIRIENALERYEEAAGSLAAGPHVRGFTAGVTAARAGRPPAGPIGGVDGFGLVDPSAAEPLGELSSRVLMRAEDAGLHVVAAAVVDPAGAFLGGSPTLAAPPDPDLGAEAVASGQPRYGSAFPGPAGDARLPLAVPIVAAGATVGALVLDMRLSPVTGPVTAHEGFADSSEAHIAQPAVDGGAQFITPARFDPEAAFVRTVPPAAEVPLRWSLSSPAVQVVRSSDYRGIDSILAIKTVARVDWGLVVKIDRAEALAPVGEIRRVLVASGAATLLVIVVGWLVLLNPLASRMRRMARAARQVTRGDLSVRIGDPGRDELAATAASIDRLAANLDADQRAREKAERELLSKARYDQLTGIANRQWATEQLARLFGESAAHPTSSLLFIDLDDFKTVNDTSGHDAGDELLRGVAERLSRLDVGDGLVARWGGDEFLVALPGRDGVAAGEAADEVRRLLAEPFALRGTTVPVRASIGVATGDATTTVDACLRAADMAMFADKLTGASAAPGERRPGRRLVHDALSAGRDEVWYQPLVHLDPMGAVATFGAEALVRLRDERGEMIRPGAFLADVESTELGVSLDRRVIARAVADLAGWQRDGAVGPDFHIALNLSPASTRDPGTAAYISAVCAEQEVDPGLLVVELSERSTEISSEAVSALRAVGVSIAVDDFGLKHSNVDRVRDCGATIAKIDRRWISDADHSLDSHDLLASMVQLCRAMDLEIVAEGVEEESQLDMLQALGVRCFQGHLFSRAVRAEDAAATFSGGSRPLAQV